MRFSASVVAAIEVDGGGCPNVVLGHGHILESNLVVVVVGLNQRAGVVRRRRDRAVLNGQQSAAVIGTRIIRVAAVYFDGTGEGQGEARQVDHGTVAGAALQLGFGGIVQQLAGHVLLQRDHAVKGVTPATP